jgi:hypothetical protein
MRGEVRNAVVRVHKVLNRLDQSAWSGFHNSTLAQVA